MYELVDVLALPTDIKALVAETLGVALEQRYLDGIEKVNGTFESFLHGSSNIRGEVDKIRFYIAEFQGLATASFEVSKIGEYLAKLVRLRGRTRLIFYATAFCPICT